MTTEKKQILDQLITFRQTEKFSATAWHNRGLNPSPADLCAKLENLFNLCVDDLIDAVNADAPQKDLKRFLKIGLSRFNKHDYDTEEKEFICDYLDQLSNVIGVKIKNHLNAFLYGWVLTALLNLTWIFKKERKAVETLSQNCTSCQIQLQTFIMAKQQNSSPSCWFIAQCNACNEYNLIYIPKDVVNLRIGAYKVTETLTDKYTEEEAKERLEQIKSFRQN